MQILKLSPVATSMDRLFDLVCGINSNRNLEFIGVGVCVCVCGGQLTDLLTDRAGAGHKGVGPIVHTRQTTY